MEPFFLRCETCQARLRVRDERFLGQIQACPKCGSMVQIVAPAGWLAQGDASAEAPPELTEVAAPTSSSAAATAIAWLRDHAVASAAGATGLLAACGLATFLTFSGDEAQTLEPPAPPAVAEAVEEPKVPVEVVVVDTSDESTHSSELPPSESSTVETFEEIAKDASTPSPEAPAETVAASESTSTSFLPLITPPETEVASNGPASQARTLTLEPVEQDSKAAPAAEESPSVAAYPPEVETAAASEASNPATDDGDPAKAAAAAADEVALPSLDPPAQRTNIKDQLSMPIESINMPAMPIGDFVSFVSTLTAVPIELDAKVLGEVGLSSHSTVDVQGKSTTAGKLLARVLKEQQLTCVERDGTLVVVRAKR